MSILGENLRSLRKSQGYSLRELSDISGVSKTTISEIECGKRTNVTENNLNKLSKALNVSYNKLLGLNDEDVELTSINEIMTYIMQDSDLELDGVLLTEKEKEIIKSQFSSILNNIRLNRR